MLCKYRMPRQKTQQTQQRQTGAPLNPYSVRQHQQEILVQNQKNVVKSSLLNTVKEGFAFGIGSSIANRIVGGLMASTPQQKQESIQINPEFEQCMKEYNDKLLCAEQTAHK